MNRQLEMGQILGGCRFLSGTLQKGGFVFVHCAVRFAKSPFLQQGGLLRLSGAGKKLYKPRLNSDK
ncbi:MAG: hypothetical protein HDT33_03585 [Clostridiales bacterium]|nr:hypothetical protein [Clostridiales bacterium]